LSTTTSLASARRVLLPPFLLVVDDVVDVVVVDVLAVTVVFNTVAELVDAVEAVATTGETDVAVGCSTAADSA
jgi:hypothetical protein